MDSSAASYDVSWFGCGEVNNGGNDWGEIYSWWATSQSASDNC